MARGALGCSISGAGPTMFAWAEEDKADEVRDAHGGRVSRAGHQSDAWITPIEPVGARIVHELGEIRPMKIHQHARRNRARHAQRGDRCAGSRRTAGCSCPERLPRRRGSTDFPRGRGAAGDRRAPARALRGWRRARGGAPRDLRGRVRLPRAAGAACASARPAPACSSCFMARPARSRISARASWPPRSNACTASARAQAHDPRRDIRRHRRRRGRGVPSAALGRRRPALSATGSCRRARRSSSRAGAGTCGRSPSSGTFDDCQRMVKEAFRIRALAATPRLSSANSINVGRLLPQMVYYAAASLAVWHARRPAGQLHRAVRQPRQRDRRASGRARSACRSATSCSRRTRTGR